MSNFINRLSKCSRNRRRKLARVLFCESLGPAIGVVKIGIFIGNDKAAYKLCLDYFLKGWIISRIGDKVR